MTKMICPECRTINRMWLWRDKCKRCGYYLGRPHEDTRWQEDDNGLWTLMILNSSLNPTWPVSVYNPLNPFSSMTYGPTSAPNSTLGGDWSANGDDNRNIPAESNSSTPTSSEDAPQSTPSTCTDDRGSGATESYDNGSNTSQCDASSSSSVDSSSSGGFDGGSSSSSE